jgi:hypothetical protein
VRKIFDLHGVVSLEGLEFVKKGLSDIDKQLKNVSTQFRKTGSSIEKVGAGLTKYITLPLVGIGAGVYKLVQSASDLNETISKTGEIFGEQTDEIKKWADTAALKFGQSKKDALDAASTFAMFGQAAGKTGSDVVSFSQRMVELSSDMASFYNTSPEDAVRAIGAALRGEMEPIRRYNVMLDDATMRQKALELGIVDSIKTALTPQQKILAATELIFEKTSQAQGDFERTSSGLANQQRILKAQYKDIISDLGNKFLPIALELVKTFREKMMPAIQGVIDEMKLLTTEQIASRLKFMAFIATVGPGLLIIGKLIKSIGEIRGAILLLNAAFLANPIGLVTVAVIGLTAAFVALNSQVRKTKDLASDIAEQNKNKTVAALEELLHYYDMIKDADKRAISQEVWDEAQKGIRAAKTTLADLGVEFSGNFAKDVDIAKGKLNELKGIAGKEIKPKAIETTVVKRKSGLSKDEIEEAAAFEQKKQDKLNEIVSKEMENRRKIRQENTDKVIEYEKNEAERVANIRQENTEKVLAWEKEMEKANAEEIAQNKSNIFQESISAFEGLSNVMSMYYDLQSKKIDNTYDKEHKRIEQLNVSDKRRDELLQQLDDKTEKKRSALRRKAAIAEKVQGVLAVGVNTAVAIMHAWATLPKIAAAIFTGVLSGIGAAQSALITAMPVPAAEGAFIKSRPGGTIVQAGEGRENEVVFPLKTGVKEMVNALIQSISSMPFGSVNNVGSSVATVNHWHIGTLVADDRGCKELERRMSPYRVMDADRKGARV